MERRPPLLIRARKRVRTFVKGTIGRLKPGANEDATYHDLLWTSLTALKTSSDAFPPLKGVVGAAFSILEISRRITHSKMDARELAGRTVEILKSLTKGICNRGGIPPPMLESIEHFESTLEEIQSEMNQLMNRGRMWRLKHLNRNEGTLRKFNTRLDDASREFMMGLAVRTELAVYQVHAQVVDASAGHLSLHNKEMLLLRGIILMNTVFFLSIPRFGGLGGLA
ncbi:hypothetical protein B0H19DRAFT_1384989 [Mycena capillaripes]|nr:hypothetical protein B0H19DRAFT_1384989 [Mycena capillaripes]